MEWNLRDLQYSYAGNLSSTNDQIIATLTVNKNNKFMTGISCKKGFKNITIGI